MKSFARVLVQFDHSACSGGRLVVVAVRCSLRRIWVSSRIFDLLHWRSVLWWGEAPKEHKVLEGRLNELKGSSVVRVGSQRSVGGGRMQVGLRVAI